MGSGWYKCNCLQMLYKLPWIWKHCHSSKSRELFSSKDIVTSQKTCIFNNSVVRTSKIATFKWLGQKMHCGFIIKYTKLQRNDFESVSWKTVTCPMIDTRTWSIFHWTVSVTSYKNRKKQEKEWIMQGIKQENDKDGRIERRIADKNEVEEKKKERKNEWKKERKMKERKKEANNKE